MRRDRSHAFLNFFWNATSLDAVAGEIATHGARCPFSHLGTVWGAHHAGCGALTLSFAQAQVAHHVERCEPVAKEEWKPQAELECKLANQGWKVSRVKMTNGCREVHGRKGGNVEAFFHPTPSSW